MKVYYFSISPSSYVPIFKFVIDRFAKGFCLLVRDTESIKIYILIGQLGAGTFEFRCSSNSCFQRKLSTASGNSI